MTAFLVSGDNRRTLRALADNSVDSVVCDPPYGLGREPNMEEVLTHWLRGDDFRASGGGFMGKTWDSFVPGPATWKEVYRVLKPGGHVVMFSGTRTWDIATLALRLAGFEIRDGLMWLYGSGFPKSMNVAQAIDKRQMSEAQQWEGWGTALKPAWEPIVLARKPIKGTVAANVLVHGTGALNIDATRIATSDKLGGGAEGETRPDQKGNEGWTRPWMEDPEAQAAHAERVRANVQKAEALGRFPANVLLSHTEACVQTGTAKVRPPNGSGRASDQSGGIGGGMFGDGVADKIPGGFVDADGMELIEVWECVDDCPVKLLDGQSGVLRARGNINPTGGGGGMYGHPKTIVDHGPGDVGGASRFFYNAKTAKRERNAGMPEGTLNDHPTVKPVALMEWLVKLITPPGGTVLDPYVGSGSTGIAAVKNGFGFVGLDEDPKSVLIAKYRITHAGAEVETLGRVADESELGRDKKEAES